MTIVYRLGCKIYLNITNACSCSCVFCIRNHTDGVGDAVSLWLEREPSLDEIKAALDVCSYDDIDEIVFCGFGEPMQRVEDVIKISQYIKSKPAPPVRVNTNGLVFLMHPGFDVSRLTIVDSVSVSLNADEPAEYQRLSRPKFGEPAFNSLLDFVREAKAYTSVALSVIEGVLNPVRMENCRRIAEKLGVPLRIRGQE